MNIEIYKKEEKEETVRVDLMLMLIGDDVVLTAVDEHGKRLSQGGLFILQGNRITRCTAVNKQLGFDLNKKGQIKFVGEE